MAQQYGSPKTPKGGPAGNRYGDKERRDQPPKTKDPDPSPSGVLVEKFHKNAAVDTRVEDMHHTLGSLPSQASPGNHDHDGGDSVLLLDGYTIVGSKASPSTVLPSIIAGLVRLGMKDSTT